MILPVWRSHAGLLLCCAAATIMASVFWSGAVAVEPGARGGFAAHIGHFNGTRIVPALQEFTAGQATLRAWQRFDLRRWQFRMELIRSQPLTQLRWVDGAESFGFEPAVGVTSLHFQVTPPSPLATVAVGAHIPDAGMQTPGWSLNFWLQPVRVLGMGFQATTPPEWPRQWTAAFSGEGGTVHWNVRTAGTSWHTSFTPGGSFRITGRLSELRMQPGSPGRDVQAQYSLWPTGMLLRRSLEVTQRIQSERILLGLELSNGDFTGRLHAYTEGASFGQMGVIEATWQSWRCSASGAPSAWEWSSVASGGSAEFVSLGIVKFWPFSDGLASLLGSRRHLQFSGSANWFHLGGHVSRRLGQRVQFGLGLDGYRVFPSLTTLSWQPLFFGMGIADPKTNQLNVTRLDLGAVHVRGQARFGRTILAHVVLKQWLPLGVEETRHSQNAPESPSSSSEATGHAASIGKGLVVSAGVSFSW